MRKNSGLTPAKRPHHSVRLLTFAALVILGCPATGYAADPRPVAACPWDPMKKCTFYRVTEERPNTTLANRASRDVPRALSESAVEELSRWEKRLGVAEIPRLRIGWHRNDTFRAYLEALRDNKPMVLFFHAINCGFCNRFLERFQCPEIERFAGRAVFAMTLGAHAKGGDDSGKRLWDAADGRAFPNVVVLEPSRNHVRIMGHAVGELKTAELAKFLEDSVGSYPGGGKASDMLSVEALKAEYRKRRLPFNVPAACGE